MAEQTTGSGTDLEALTAQVVASFDGAESPRFKEVIQSLVKHLHAFVKDVEPTEAEWFKAIDFLTRVGQMCDDRRQEFILLSDTLGVSMLTVGINSSDAAGATESTVFGPFFVEQSPLVELGGDLANGAQGQPCWMEGRVLSTSGEPVAGARVEVWQSDEAGFYDVQYEGLEDMRGRGHQITGDDGRYAFWSVLPVAYPIPHDGPVGELLTAGARGPMRPAHVHFMVDAPGHERLITHVFVEGDEYLDSDAVFGVKQSLVSPFERHEPGTAPDGTDVDRPFYTMGFDLVVAPSRANGAGPA